MNIKQGSSCIFSNFKAYVAVKACIASQKLGIHGFHRQNIGCMIELYILLYKILWKVYSVLIVPCTITYIFFVAPLLSTLVPIESNTIKYMIHCCTRYYRHHRKTMKVYCSAILMIREKMLPMLSDQMMFAHTSDETETHAERIM